MALLNVESRLDREVRYIRRPEVVADFYYRVLGYHALRAAADGGHWVIHARAEEDDAEQREIVRKLPDSAPEAANFLAEFTVSNLVDCAQRVEVFGGTVNFMDSTPQGWGGAMAFCNDPEGNSFSLFEPSDKGETK